MDLVELLSDLYKTPDIARAVVVRTHLPENRIDFGGSALAFWSEILLRAREQNRVTDLVAVARKDYPEQAAILEQAQQRYLHIWTDPESSVLQFKTLIDDRTAEFVGRDFVFRFIDSFMSTHKRGYIT